MKGIIEASFHPVLTWHPAWPRKEGEKLEPEIWDETNGWNGGVILWIVSPDRKIREPIEYLKHKDPKALEERIREIARKHSIKLEEPK